jgi:hypothetical protein
MNGAAHLRKTNSGSQVGGFPFFFLVKKKEKKKKKKNAA